MTFTQWLDTFISEKNIDTEKEFEIEGDNGLNIIPVGCVIETIKATCKTEQKQIKETIVKIDFMNGDVYHFFNYLAQAMAI